MKYLFTIIFIVFSNLATIAQADTVLSQRQVPSVDNFAGDSINVIADTGISRSIDSLPLQQTPVFAGMDSLYLKLVNNPYLKMTGQPVYLIIKPRQREDKDEIFYLLAGLLLFLAFIKLIFPKYFSNVFQLFFQPSFRQKQTREQLLQSALPSLLLNLFFIFSAATYVALLLDYYNVAEISFWLLFFYSSLLLLVLYTGKYVFISFTGWVFNVKLAADTYMFVVFLINKIIGVLLIPFILIIAFSDAELIDASITASLLLIGLLFFYRFVVSFSPVRREVKVSALHFLFYILAFEITPLLLIYKSLIIYLDKSL